MGEGGKAGIWKWSVPVVVAGKDARQDRLGYSRIIAALWAEWRGVIIVLELKNRRRNVPVGISVACSATLRCC